MLFIHPSLIFILCICLTFYSVMVLHMCITLTCFCPHRQKSYIWFSPILYFLVAILGVEPFYILEIKFVNVSVFRFLGAITLFLSLWEKCIYNVMTYVFVELLLCLLILLFAKLRILDIKKNLTWKIDKTYVFW